MAEAVRPKSRKHKVKTKIKARQQDEVDDLPPLLVIPKNERAQNKDSTPTDNSIKKKEPEEECKETKSKNSEEENVQGGAAQIVIGNNKSQIGENKDQLQQDTGEQEQDQIESTDLNVKTSEHSESVQESTSVINQNTKYDNQASETVTPDQILSKMSMSGSFSLALSAVPAVVEDPDTPMARATPPVSRGASEESKSPIPIVHEEKSPHLLAEEAFARMRVLAADLSVSNPETNESSERSATDAKLKSQTELSHQDKTETTSVSAQTHQNVQRPLLQTLNSSNLSQTKIRAMSLSELIQMYHNHQLSVNEMFVEEFVQNEMKKENHEFFEILSNYQRARLQLVNVEEEVQLLQKKYNTLQEEMWITATKTVLAQGECGDKSKVTAVHTYEQCELNRDAVKRMEDTLKKIRDRITTDLSLFAYSSTISKLQVESYIHEFYTNCPLLRDIPRNAPVQAHKQYPMDPEGISQICKLKDCISILFVFHRKPVTDQEFVNNIRSWTIRLVSTLLRVATFRDHLFVLNHILRCPAGVGKWAVELIQFTAIPSPTLSYHSSFVNDVLDHIITALSTILLPIKAREEFLSQMKINLTAESIQEEKAWILVDSDGEEDEEPSNAWLYLHENDVVAVLNQFSLANLFSHILLSTISETGQVDYDIRRTTEPVMIKLLSFSTVLVQLFGCGLRTYNMVRYRQLNKRIGRLIRHTISFVSDHWLNFQMHFGPMTTTASMDSLQMEFDQLFMRATYCILAAEKLGSWQFMADMPYTCVSENAMWQLVWILHQGQGQVLNLDFLPPVQECKTYLKDPDSWQQLADNLTHVPTSEAFFLMTTFANMACCRSYAEQDFVQTITHEVFEIAYISTHTRDFCSKVGRELLASIIQTHPRALSFLLARVQEVMSMLGKMALYLFAELPIGIWQPTDPDMLILRQWLLNFSISFVENQLARGILSQINWDVFEQNGRPVVDIRLHRQIALLLVESYTRYISDKKAGFFIIEGMKHMASCMTSTPSPEQVFNNWAWDLALKLKLHQQSVIWQAGSIAVDTTFKPPSLAKESWLMPVLNGTVNKVPIACYIALSMTEMGHDITIIMRDGLDLLGYLTSSGQYTTAIHVIGCLVPMFGEFQDYLLENECFQQILQTLMLADESLLKSTKSTVMTVEFPGLVTRQFNEMIQAQIASHLTQGKADLLLAFWMKAMYKVSRYFMDRNCCYIMDSLAHWCFVKKGVTDLFMKIIKEYFTHFCAAGKDSQNVVSTMLSWISSSQTNIPSFLDSNVIPEFPFLAFLVTMVEGEVEFESGLWQMIQLNLHGNSRTGVDAALKNAISTLRLQQTPLTHKLIIYRWSKQALDTPLDHPLLPVFWQRFFVLYLGRQTSPNSMAQRASVGERFFESMSYSSMLKKMKRRLKETSDYHLNYDPKEHKDIHGGNNRSSESLGQDTTDPHFDGVPDGGAIGGASAPSSPDNDSGFEYRSTKEFHQMLARLYQTFALWLEEPRLHDANLYLPALPPQYESSRLNQVFQGYTGPWLEFVDTECIQYKVSCLNADWRKRLSGTKSAHQGPPNRHKLNEPENATKRIERRLKRYDPPKDPPEITKIQSAVPSISPSIVMDKESFLQLASSDLEALRQHTQIFSAKNANHCALDDSYIHLVPSLFSNVAKVIQLTAGCTSNLNPLHRCAMPAVIPVRINEKERNEIIFRRVQENRVEYKQLMIEMLVPTPLNICVAAVHTENAITGLIKQCQKSTVASVSKRLQDIGCSLFLYLTSLVSEETNFYPPAKHFFASCIEILGQEFVSQDPMQTETVLQLCLDRPMVSCLVSPHYVPNSCPSQMVGMYSQLIHVLQDQNMDLVFMLLTKFDINVWLESHHPSEPERKRFVEILGSALTACGPNPDSKSNLVFGLYVSHLRSLLRSNFPSNLQCVLNMILQGSASEGLDIRVWETFLSVCFSDHPAHSTPFDAVNMENCNEVLLSTAQVKEFLDWMSSYFTHARIQTCQGKGHGLYTSWSRYIYHISLFVGGLIRSFATKLLRGSDSDDISNSFKILECLWSVYAPWIQPMVGDNEMLNTPWMEGNHEAASHMISSLAGTLESIHQMILAQTPDRAPGLLSLVLMYYSTILCTKTTPPYAVESYVRSIQGLPWETLMPDLQLVEAMTKVKENASPCCFAVIGHILPHVNWEAVNGYHIHHTPPEIASRMQTGIALLLIQAYVDPILLAKDDIYRLLMAAESFNWSRLTTEGITCMTSWFLQLSDPACVLAERTSRLAIGLRLLKQACSFTTNVVWQGLLVAKRQMYIHVTSQLFCQLTYIQGTNKDSIKTVLVNLLSEIEAVESSVPCIDGQADESAGLLKSICGLLNNSNPDGPWLDLILSTLTGWLESSPQSILLAPCIKSASTCLASLRHMAIVMEACLNSYFKGLDNTSPVTNGWDFILSIFHIPELNPAGFVQEALNENAFLVLYSYFRHRIPFCTTVGESFGLVEEILEISQRAQPCEEDEMKILLWWHLMFYVIAQQLKLSPIPLVNTLSVVNRFIPTLNAMGLERNNKGLLGAIGLGQKSPLSKKMRLMTITLSSYLQSQVLGPHHLRLDSANPISCSQLPKELRSLRTAKSYSFLSANCDKAIVFMRDPSHSLRETAAFISMMGTDLYPDHAFVNHAFALS